MCSFWCNHPVSNWGVFKVTNQVNVAGRKTKRLVLVGALAFTKTSCGPKLSAIFGLVRVTFTTISVFQMYEDEPPRVMCTRHARNRTKAWLPRGIGVEVRLAFGLPLGDECFEKTNYYPSTTVWNFLQAAIGCCYRSDFEQVLLFHRTGPHFGANGLQFEWSQLKQS